MRQMLRDRWVIAFIVFVIVMSFIGSNIQKKSSAEDTEQNVITQK